MHGDACSAYRLGHIDKVVELASTQTTDQDRFSCPHSLAQQHGSQTLRVLLVARELVGEDELCNGGGEGDRGMQRGDMRSILVKIFYRNDVLSVVMTLLWFVLMVRIGMRVRPSLIVSQPHDSITMLRKTCQRRPDATHLHEVHLLLHGALLHVFGAYVCTIYVCTCGAFVYI